MKNDDNLRQQVEQRVRRLVRAERERPTVLGQSVYLGTLGLLLVLPVIGGAYLGRWLDGMASGYSIRWTISMIFLGLVIGGFNAYLLIREP
ncbi:AtpZ/AtpI family protein [Pelobacter propionicus]|uniref:Putative ATP synthase protein I n=1 Tax=Pelobacter propionicus (strain DSM 2379 / NBRC 103807 / OttBd1) TaxID=338966 RepID=A1AMA8_PELPD|nr:AtpZ/AtpI family protein [Pelobacter propionicus]ABK98478.1 putative ATP synthase protein I [Pelobacter propionicus DSM 2379]